MKARSACGACGGEVRPKLILKSRRASPLGCADGLVCVACKAQFPCQDGAGHVGAHSFRGLRAQAPAEEPAPAKEARPVAAVEPITDRARLVEEVGDPAVRMALGAMLSRATRGQVASLWRQPQRPALHGELPPDLSPALLRALERDGAPFRPYLHQAKAIGAALAGENVVIATGTGSGKSLCYNVPVLDSLLESPQARAIYIFPTLALAQDQLRVLRELTAKEGLRHLNVETYDGDTPEEQRKAIRFETHPRVIITNPDMLHWILLHHEKWEWLFRNLRHVVIDEVHAYKGVFGSHVANILRRLRRVGAHHRSRPAFICCSATISEARPLAERLCGAPFTLVDEDGSPQGARTYVFWNPPQDSTGSDGTPHRIPPYIEATQRFVEHVRARVRTIAFARSRKQAELMLRLSQRQLQETSPGLERAVESYRSGYTTQERREIERRLSEGRLLGVASTNALELGIDVGGLDGCIVTTFPGSVASFRQQAGRAGRGGREALVTFVADDDPLNQAWLLDARRLIEGASEAVAIRPENPAILDLHVRCALAELPARAPHDASFGSDFAAALDRLQRAGLARWTGSQWTTPGEPHLLVHIRNVSESPFVIWDRLRRREVGEMDGSRVFRDLHEEAVYLHRGETYLVEELDLLNRRAIVRNESVPYHTEARAHTTLHVEGEEASRGLPEARLFLGSVTAVERVSSYVKIGENGRQVEAERPLELPPSTLRTRALGCRLASVAPDEAPALHAAQHVLGGLVPVVVSCDRSDVRFPCPGEDEAGVDALYLYDAYEGGVGIADAAYREFDALVDRAIQTVARCPCPGGCPSCIQSASCARRNRGLDKAGALRVLRRLRASAPV